MATAMVTGASRGVGRGVATALADAGYRVFATGRGIAGAELPAEVERIVCDHLDDTLTAEAFERVRHSAGGLDLLVNAAWGGYERMVEGGAFTWTAPFWEQPLHRWRGMIDQGLRAAFVCSQAAARLMVPLRSGLIVGLSYWAARRHLGNAIYGVAQARTTGGGHGRGTASARRRGDLPLPRPGADRAGAGSGGARRLQPRRQRKSRVFRPGDRRASGQAGSGAGTPWARRSWPRNWPANSAPRMSTERSRRCWGVGDV